MHYSVKQILLWLNILIKILQNNAELHRVHPNNNKLLINYNLTNNISNRAMEAMSLTLTEAIIYKFWQFLPDIKQLIFLYHT